MGQTAEANLRKVLRDACVKAAKEWTKKANVSAGGNEKVVEVFTNILFDTAELVMEGKHLTAAQVSLLMTQRLAENHMLLDDQLIRCIAASVGFLAGAPKTVQVGRTFGVPGIVVAAAWLLADAIEPGGECYLFYLDEQGEKQVEAFKQKLDAARQKGRQNAAPLPWDELNYSPAEAQYFYTQLSCQ